MFKKKIRENQKTLTKLRQPTASKLDKNYYVICIYNCDQIEFYYGVLPDIDLCCFGEKPVGRKLQKDGLFYKASNVRIHYLPVNTTSMTEWIEKIDQFQFLSEFIKSLTF